MPAAESRPGSQSDRKSGREEKSSGAPIRVMTSIEFLNGSALAFQTPVVQATQINTPARDAVAFQFDVPLDSLQPGTYICQVNVIDDAGGDFTFPRTAILIRPAAGPAPAAPAPSPGTTSGKGN